MGQKTIVISNDRGSFINRTEGVTGMYKISPFVDVDVDVDGDGSAPSLVIMTCGGDSSTR